MRRLAAAVLLLAAVPAARPAAAQPSLTTYTGCNIYFCTLVERTDYTDRDEAGVPFQYTFGADFFFTLRQPIIDQAPDIVSGNIGLPLDDLLDFEGGVPFSLGVAGHRAGDVLTGSGAGNGRTRPGPFGLLDVALYRDVTLPDGSRDVWSDEVANALLLTPEPATSALLATGLVAAGWARRRRRAHS